jgi:4-hydroxyproline epimerase
MAADPTPPLNNHPLRNDPEARSLDSFEWYAAEHSPGLVRVPVLDSHTAGEPTRLVLAGGPDLGNGPLAERLARLSSEYPGFRTRVLAEPRGSDVLVGALLCDPVDPTHAAGVIFFNDVGYLGMCGHGMIGLIHSLAYLGKISTGSHTIETPVGLVEATLHASGEITVSNVPSYCFARDVAVEVPDLGRVSGDLCWGGNWFYIVHTAAPVQLQLAQVAGLTRHSIAVRWALQQAGYTGADGALIDHIEWCSDAMDPRNDSRNFVLCPGVAYDRSPCGTGTSARLASLAARGELRPGTVWRQEGILGTVFTASYKRDRVPGIILPSITGRAHVTAETTLLFEKADPFGEGISPMTLVRHDG